MHGDPGSFSLSRHVEDLPLRDRRRRSLGARSFSESRKSAARGAKKKQRIETRKIEGRKQNCPRPRRTDGIICDSGRRLPIRPIRPASSPPLSTQSHRSHGGRSSAGRVGHPTIRGRDGPSMHRQAKVAAMRVDDARDDDRIKIVVVVVASIVGSFAFCIARLATGRLHGRRRFFSIDGKSGCDGARARRPMRRDSHGAKKKKKKEKDRRTKKKNRTFKTRRRRREPASATAKSDPGSVRNEGEDDAISPQDSGERDDPVADLHGHVRESFRNSGTTMRSPTAANLGGYHSRSTTSLV